jgi:amino acid adenylation domain-containing protein
MNEIAYRLSPQQARASDDGRAAQARLRLPAPRPQAQVAAALEAVLSAHEIFRTRVRSTPQGRYQFVAERPTHTIVEAASDGFASSSGHIESPESVEARLSIDADGLATAIELIAPSAMFDCGSFQVLARLIGRALRGEGYEAELQYADIFADAPPVETQAAEGEEARTRIAVHEVGLGASLTEIRAAASRWSIPIEALMLALSAGLLDRFDATELSYVFDARCDAELADVPGRLDCAVSWAIPRAEGMRMQGLASWADHFVREHVNVETAIGAQAALRARANPVQLIRYRADPDVAIERIDAPMQVDGFGFRWLDDGSDLRLQIHYDPERMPLLSVELLSDGLAAWISAALGNAPLSSLTLQSESLRDWYRNLPREQVDKIGDAATLPGFIAHWAQIRPDSPALDDIDGRSWTYSQLHARITCAAALLIERGIRPGDRVGVALGRSDLHILSMLAIMAAGAVYVPIDPHHPIERNRRIAADAGLRLLIVNDAGNDIDNGMSGGKNSAGSLAIDVARIEAGELLRASPSSLPLPVVPAQAHAYIVFTSGTTGRPKGVAIGHAALCAYAGSLLARIEAPGDARFAMLSTLAADLGYTSVFGAFVGGGCYCVLPDRMMLDGAAAAAAIRERRIDILKIVPSHWLALSEQAQAAGEGELHPRYCLVFGGDRLDDRVLARIADGAPDLRVFNHYGPTETTVGVLATHVRDRSGTPPLGLPLAHVEARVLDASLNPCLPSQQGEFAFSGVALASGYWGRPAATAERFRPDPVASVSGARMYLTGDRGYVDPTGHFYFLGRQDDQIKLAGQRIDLGEVEAALRSALPDAASVVLVDDSGAEKVLRAFVRASAPVDSHTLLSRLAESLPEHMLPASVHTVGTLPLTANGKIDRAELLAVAERENAGGVVEPQTAEEYRLRDLWAELLGVAPQMIGRDSNFFRSGGHSLLAARMLARIRNDFEREISIRAFFEHATLAGFARLLGATPPHAQTLRLAPGPKLAEYPLSLGQERLWSIAASGQDDLAYNSSYQLRLVGDIDVERMRECLQAVQMRHQPLHSVIVADADGLPRMRPMSEPTPVDVIDLRDTPDIESSVREIVKNDSSRPFSLDRETPIRVSLLRTGAQEWRLVMIVHHVAWDGWSGAVFLDELFEAYRSGIDALRHLPLNYGDFALAERDALEQGRFEPLFDYWQRQLAGLPTLDLSGVDYGRARAPFQGAQTARALSDDVARGLAELASATESTMFMTTLAAWYVTLHRHSGQSDLAIGTSAANRSHADIEGLIGFFVNQLVMRGDLSGNPDLRQLIGRVRTMVLAAFEHQAVPFGTLVSRLRELRRPGRTPLYQSMFVMQSMTQSTPELPGIEAVMEGGEIEHSKFDLTLYLQETAHGALKAVLVYDQSLISAVHADQIVDDYATVLGLLAQNPDRTVAETVQHLTRASEIAVSSKKFQGLKPRAGASERALQTQTTD